jgi:hypothetical protein
VEYFGIGTGPGDFVPTLANGSAGVGDALLATVGLNGAYFRGALGVEGQVDSSSDSYQVNNAGATVLLIAGSLYNPTAGARAVGVLAAANPGRMIVTSGGVARLVKGTQVIGAAMTRAGTTRAAYQALHHIVLQGSRHWASAAARALLGRYGLTTEVLQNGVYLARNRWLPNTVGTVVHSTIHTNAYKIWVLRQLQSAEQAAIRAGGSHTQIQNALLDRLTLIGDVLTMGRTPWIR